MPPPALSLGQILRGRLTWAVHCIEQDPRRDMACKVCDSGCQRQHLRQLDTELTLTIIRDQSNEVVVVKSVSGHPRVENERGVLQRFQSRSTHIRPLIDEIQDPARPTAIILRHLEDDLLNASIQKPLSRKEIKYVSRAILEALNVLHEDGYVHTDVKPSNVFVNHRKHQSEVRFSDVQLGDFGGSYHQESE